MERDLLDTEDLADERDYIAEMDERIAELTQGSGWVAAAVAARLYRELLWKDRDLLSGWLYEMGPDTLRRHIQGRAAAQRARERARAARGEFADAAHRFETGEDSNGAKLVGMFALTHVVDVEDRRKRAGEMTGADHLYVANTYTARGQRNLLEAEFHRAVAKKVGDRRTDEVISLADYEHMYRSVVGN